MYPGSRLVPWIDWAIEQKKIISDVQAEGREYNSGTAADQSLAGLAPGINNKAKRTWFLQNWGRYNFSV